VVVVAVGDEAVPREYLVSYVQTLPDLWQGPQGMSPVQRFFFDLHKSQARVIFRRFLIGSSVCEDAKASAVSDFLVSGLCGVASARTFSRIIGNSITHI